MTLIIGQIMIALGIGLVVYKLSGNLRHRVSDYEDRYVTEASEKLDALYVFIDPEQLLAITVWLSAGLGLAGFFLLLRFSITGAFFAGAILSILGFFTPKIIIMVMVAKRQKLFLKQLADALGMMANAMRSGVGVQQSLDLVATEMPAPISQEFRIIIRDQQLGRSLDESIARLAQRMPLVEVRMFAMVVTLANKMGGNISEALTRVAETIRNRHVIAEKVKTLTTGARTQGIVLGFMPFLIGVGFWFTAPEMMRPFLLSKVGVFVGCLIVVLQSIGAYCMWQISRIKY